ncbi:MAG: TSUP family transporter [Candidatus Binatia bacterium]
MIQPMVAVWMILVGALAGVLSGILGVGGGIIVIPLLVHFFHMSQHEAQGTSLAMLLPPIGILAFLEYYRAGHVNLAWAMLICLGFIFGAGAGGYVAQYISDPWLRRVFAVFFIFIGTRMLIWP